MTVDFDTPDGQEVREAAAYLAAGLTARARVGLIDRAAPDRGVRWHEIGPCWVFHPLNAYETEAGVVVDAAGATQSWEAEPGHSLSEAVFTPHSPGAGEGEGWVIAVDSTPRESEVVVFDATALSAGPIARVRLPQRIPDGFHGDWLPTAR